MPLRTTDTILSDRIANPEAVLARLGRPSDADRAFAFALVRYCRVAGVDPVLALVQWLLETANATSPRWVNDRNSSGIGIVANDTKQPFRIPSIDAAAALHVQCLYSLVTRNLEPNVPLWGAAYAWMDEVWLPKVRSKSMPDVEEVSDLGLRYTESGKSRATWSWEDGKVSMDTYGKKLVSRALQFYPDAPEQKEHDDTMPEPVVFGRVPVPVHEKRLVTNSRAWNDLGKRTMRGVVWHRMYGTLWGTDTYFRGAAVDRALTDIGIGVTATDGAANDGRCFMWCDPASRRSPWANGPVTNPRNDGKAFVERYGVNGSQRDLFSIEISGNGDTALSAGARKKVIEWTAYWADQYKVGYDAFPLLPGEGNRSFVIWHGELNGGKWGTCPGPVVERETNAMIAEVKATLKRYQESAAPEYATPQPVEAGTRVINDRLFVGVDKAYTIRRTTTPRLWADSSSPATGADLQSGDIVTVSHMVEDVGEASGLTLVLANGARIPALALVPGGEA